MKNGRHTCDQRQPDLHLLYKHSRERQKKLQPVRFNDNVHKLLPHPNKAKGSSGERPFDVQNDLRKQPNGPVGRLRGCPNFVQFVCEALVAASLNVRLNRRTRKARGAVGRLAFPLSLLALSRPCKPPGSVFSLSTILPGASGNMGKYSFGILGVVRAWHIFGPEIVAEMGSNG
jgi:hypothetical protein